MKRFLIALFLIIIGFFSLHITASAAEVASLGFDKSSYTVATGDTISVQVTIDPGSDQILGSDAHVTYDSTLLQPVNVVAGTYFPSVNNSITTGKVSLYSTVADPQSPKTGTGTIATITFKGLKNGKANLAFFCDSTAYNTSKILKNDINATNIITCSQNGTAAVTVGTGVGDTTPTATPTPATGSGTGSGSGVAPTPITRLPATGTVADLMPIILAGFALVGIGGAVKFFV